MEAEISKAPLLQFLAIYSKLLLNVLLSGPQRLFRTF